MPGANVRLSGTVPMLTRENRPGIGEHNSDTSMIMMSEFSRPDEVLCRAVMAQKGIVVEKINFCSAGK